jgi:CBS domain-containing protein
MPVHGATPLFALDAIAIDIETTGLDASRAHAVQFGAIPIAKGVLKPDDACEQMLNPGIPIPSSSIAIHGITDAMVRNAPTLSDVWPNLVGQWKNRVVIGHSIGFDLTVLAAEAKRKKLDWQKPRALCVRMLATIAAPTLASHSLDALATWLNLETRNRHRALGDAEAAGLIFLALIPHLQARGIRTLAEAERACCGLTAESIRHSEAGWEPPVTEPDDSVLGRVDTFVYSHRVADIMTSPVITVANDTPLSQAMEIMASRAISSVFVTPSGEALLPVDRYSIVTERDAIRHIVLRGSAALEDPVGSIGSRPIRTIREQAFLYRAVGRMTRMGFRHLGVHSEANTLVGVVSARDLLKLRDGPAVELTDAIDEAASSTELALAWSTLPRVVQSLTAEQVDARLIAQIISEEIRSMTRRAAILASQAMQDEGLGDPPCPFSILVLGSGGRGESLLVPDQDNAIVFETGEPDGPEDAWFAELGARTAEILDTAGIPYCTGGVMAKNPEWRGSVHTWHSRIDRWLRQSRQQDLLNVDIFFDAAPVHGTLSLGHALFDYAYAKGSRDTAFAKLLGERLASVHSPLSLFGRLKTRDGRLDIKMHILFPVASAARALAIRHDITQRSTRQRLEGLTALGLGNDGDLTAMQQAHALGLTLLLAQQSHDISQGRKPTTSIDLATLSRRQRVELKKTLAELQNIPMLLRSIMFETSPSRSSPATNHHD